MILAEVTLPPGVRLPGDWREVGRLLAEAIAGSPAPADVAPTVLEQDEPERGPEPAGPEATVQWQITDGGVREVTASPANPMLSQWAVTPAGGGTVEKVPAADLAPTEEVALLIWHERGGDTAAAAEIVARIGARYRASRIPAQREPGAEL